MRDTDLLKGLVAFGVTAWLAFPLIGLVAATGIGPIGTSDVLTVVLTTIGGLGVGLLSTLANGCPFGSTCSPLKA